MRIAIVVGETSGDMLGIGLMKALKKQYPDATFEGIGGPLMEEEGFTSFVPMERLAVMGLVEILGRLFELLKVRKKLVQHWQKKPPDVFIGIDAPEFNTQLEYKLKQSGIKTVHYVSPSVWAWRSKRIHKIKKSVDLMLTLFPFEAKFYQQHDVPVAFVGHNLADSISFENNAEEARQTFHVEKNEKVVCLMPGSRGSEVEKLCPVFIQAAELIYSQNPNVRFILPAANHTRKKQIEQCFDEMKPAVKIDIVDGHSKTCMQAADVVLLASGTATLEGMLLKKPMVVSYIVSPITAMIMRRLMKQDFISLPNLLAGREVVPEIIQEQATAENLAKAVNERLENEDLIHQLQETFLFIHKQLKRGANEQAALAVVNLLESSTCSDDA
ncbi:MAG TPA: lipid-A-disaccharide synthase [Oceanospirillales bacterium]|nr:lipid-A-disaccharide synthase [Oceanospirillales bacterium]|tara:strand:+ start:763 stop:1917 length:1155 start_codon:yes stop_codon:yes gene_type:complete